MTTEFRPRVLHTLLVPGEFKLGGDEPGEPDLIAWTGVATRDVDPAETAQCIWDLIAIREDILRRLPAFVRKWGLLDCCGESPAIPGEDGSQLVGDWLDAASEVEILVSAIAMTEEDQLVSDAPLWELRHGDGRSYADYSRLQSRGGDLTMDEVHGLAYREQRAYYANERRAGRGIALQQDFIVSLLGEFAFPPEWRKGDGPQVPLSFAYRWDQQGRRLEARASGVREVVSAHLLSMFAAPELDVFVCSVCTKPFARDPARTPRRPRKGVKRLCSEDCRLIAKRESNRSSWNKNKDRWRPRRKGRR